MEGLTLLADRLTAIADDFHRSHGLHGTDSAALHVLSRRGMTMRELARALQLSPGAVTSVVDRLEAAGLAERRPDERDRRRTIVSALPVADPAADDFHRRVFDALSNVPPDELAGMTRIVASLRDALG
jgi:DNA-binding MarR family transcriptional regulator